jgi:hypothetical protein
MKRLLRILRAVRGCLRQILADFVAMSTLARKGSSGDSSVPSVDTAVRSLALPAAAAADAAAPAAAPAATCGAVREVGGRAGPEPTRFGDWEKNGRCIDF